MLGDTYTPLSSTPSHSPSPNRTPPPDPNKSEGKGYVNGSTNGESKTSPQAAAQNNGLQYTNASGTGNTFYGHEREQVARILIQGLQDLGYSSAAQALSDESGYELESSSASAFRNAVTAGRWREAESLLYTKGKASQAEVGTTHSNGNGVVNGHSPKRTQNGLALSEEADRDKMLFLIRQQKYLELLEQGDVPNALQCLRQELHPLHQDQRQLHSLSSLIMCRSPEEVKTQASWDGAHGQSRRTLLSNLSSAISPSAMIPEHRLAHLLGQWKDSQLQNCLYHNTPETPSLYIDHSCTRDDFPLEILAELDQHTNEVWFVQFSNDGKHLATSGKDRTVVIYDATTFRQKHVLSEHRDGVASVAWSPDDKILVSCSTDREGRLWDTNNGRCIRVLKLHEEPVTSAAWAPDGQSFVLGSMDRNRPLSIWRVDSSSPDPSPLHTFEKSCDRVQDCAVAAIRPSSAFDDDLPSSNEGSASPIRLVAMCLDQTVNIFDYSSHEKLQQVSIGHVLTSISISNDGQEMLLNLSCNEIWSLGVEDGLVRQKYSGQQQGNFVIRSCYGGASEGFVVSGSEDGRICVWHRHTGRLLEQLDGHNGSCTNTVTWNKANPSTFASAGDDSKVRVWAPARATNGLREVIRSSRPPSSALANGEGSNGQNLPRWGANAFGGAASNLTAALRRQY